MACTNPSEQQLYIRENFLKLKRLYNGESIIDIDGKSLIRLSNGVLNV